MRAQNSIDQSSIRQLEAERRELLRKLSDECIARQSAEHKYTDIKNTFTDYRGTLASITIHHH